MTMIGIFLPNCNNGYIVSKAVPPAMPDYAYLRELTVLAEDLGYDQALSMVKYRGFGGDTSYWDYYTESFTLMAGLAEATSRIQLFATAGILALHPQLAARMISTIDDISGGRIGLNIVTGGWQHEYDQFKAWPGPHYYSDRYEYATEYARILNALWTEGRASSESELWPMTDCEALMRPRNHIPLVNAGTSTGGQRFTAQYCDYSFAFMKPDLLPGYVGGLRAQAAAVGRQVKTLALFHVLIGDTEAQGAEIYENIIAQADIGAITRMGEILAADKVSDGSADKFKSGKTDREIAEITTFMSFPVLYGSGESIADQMNAMIAESGVDGFMLSFDDYRRGMRLFAERVRPRLTRV